MDEILSEEQLRELPFSVANEFTLFLAIDAKMEQKVIENIMMTDPVSAAAASVLFAEEEEENDNERPEENRQDHPATSNCVEETTGLASGATD